MITDIKIEDLSRHANFIPLLAHLHFKQWGDMTGASSESDYEVLLAKNASALKLPLTLVALSLMSSYLLGEKPEHKHRKVRKERKA